MENTFSTGTTDLDTNVIDAASSDIQNLHSSGGKHNLF